MTLIDTYISQVSQKEHADRQGSNHRCYFFDDYALLKGAFYESDIKFVIEKSKELSSNGVAVIPTLEYKKVKDIPNSFFLGYVLQQKAKGEELYKTYFSKQSANEYYAKIKELAGKPQKFFDKFASDWMAICKSGLQIDPSKSSNFFYTPEGISFIDLCKANKPKYQEYAFGEAAVVLFNGGSYYHFTKHDQHKDILNKLVHAFSQQGESMEKMKMIAQRHFPDIADNVFTTIKSMNYMIKNTKERE